MVAVCLMRRARQQQRGRGVGRTCAREIVPFPFRAASRLQRTGFGDGTGVKSLPHATYPYMPDQATNRLRSRRTRLPDPISCDPTRTSRFKEQGSHGRAVVALSCDLSWFGSDPTEVSFQGKFRGRVSWKYGLGKAGRDDGPATPYAVTCGTTGPAFRGFGTRPCCGYLSIIAEMDGAGGGI
ncbi:unnamed protein product [Calypogeia fissa]